jgi:prephenate dehydrogenase
MAEGLRASRLTIVGLGLIGGSIARGARARGLADEIVAVVRGGAGRIPPGATGVVDRFEADLATGVRGADLIVLCAPVGVLPELLRTAWPHLGPGAVATDVGSVKRGIVEAAERCTPRGEVAFVGGHPMAGSERSGFGASDGDLFEGRTVLLTPTAATPEAATERVARFWQALGSQVRCLSVDAHDRGVALISHLPHLVAYALAALVDDDALTLAGRGFADTTRIAASAEALWADIFRQNRAWLLDAVVRYRDLLEHWRSLIVEERWDRLEAELGRAREVREKLG